MPYIQFPDVPQVPGVPPMVRSGLNSILALTGGLALLNSLGLPSNFLTPVWGLFDQSGNPVFYIQSLISFSIRNETRTSEFPVELGGFNAYNKAGSPFEAKLRFAQGIDQASRSALVASLEIELQSENLYDIVTPDGVYHSATLVSYDYRRETKGGAGMIVVDLALREVRQTAVAIYSSANGSQNAPITAAQAKAPAAASPVSQGQAQALTPTAAQAPLLKGAV